MSTALETTVKSANRPGATARIPDIAHLPLWSWWAAAFAIIAAKAWYIAVTNDPGFFNFFGDTDDAARLIEIRELMHGAPWFDTTTYKMGGIHGMLSHWSRLLDLPIAALIAFFSLFVSVPAAENLTRAIWPLMVLAPFLWALLRTTTTASGVIAGRIALLLAILCPLGFYQFDVGRLDHHNVMIASTVSAALMMWAYPASLRAWRWAGALLGLALCIGYEALAPAAALAVFAALWGLLDPRQSGPVRTFTAALMVAIAAGFFLTIPPSRWMDIRCDAISLNFVALSAIAGTGLIAALSLSRSSSLIKRFAVTAAFAGAGIAVYGGLEPKCLAGPMGQLPKELTPIWLDYVSETRSVLIDFFQGRIEQSLGIVVYLTLAVATATWRFRVTRSAPNAFLLAAVAAFAVLACWQFKYLSYASYIAIAPLAWSVSRIEGWEEVKAPVLQVGAAILVSQAALVGASGKLQELFHTPQIVKEELRVGAEACETMSSVKDLAVLPKGLIAAHIDLGAYVAASTQHRILSAPYHRIPGAIIANHHIFAARDDDDAARLLKRENVDYIVTCKGLDDPFVQKPDWQGTLRAKLVSGTPPAFLERVPLTNPKTLYTVWRVKKAAL